MLKKDYDVDWTNPSAEKLKDLMKRLASPPVLGLTKRDGRYMVDTKEYALGEVILQDQEKSTERREKDSKEGKTAHESALE